MALDKFVSSVSSPCADGDSALSLLLAAFDGVPHAGTRQLRLSEQEYHRLQSFFPKAHFFRLEPSGEKSWFAVTID